MNGRERIKAAFSKNGVSEIPVVIGNTHIFIKDHWSELSKALPWWYKKSQSMEQIIFNQKNIVNKIGEDRVELYTGYSYKEFQEYTFNSLNYRFYIIKSINF